MSELTPEQLKVIAEGMGYKTKVGETLLIHIGNAMYRAYNPLVNNDQCMEIMVKLKISAEPSLWSGDFGWISGIYDDDDDYESGETPQEAVCNAAFKYFTN